MRRRRYKATRATFARWDKKGALGAMKSFAQGWGTMIAFTMANEFWDVFEDVIYALLPEEFQEWRADNTALENAAIGMASGTIGATIGFAIGGPLGAMIGWQAGQSFLPAFFDYFVQNLFGEDIIEALETGGEAAAFVEGVQSFAIGSVTGKLMSKLIGTYGPKAVGKLAIQLAGPRLKALQFIGATIGFVIGTTAGDNIMEGLSEGLKTSVENMVGIELDDTIIDQIISSPLSTLAGIFGGRALGKAAAGWIGSQAGRLGMFAGVSRFLGGAVMGALGFIGAGIASVIIIAIVESLTAGIGPAIDEGTRQGIINAQFGGSAFRYIGDQMSQHMSGSPLVDRSQTGAEIGHMLTDPNYFADQIPVQGFFGGGPMTGGIRRQWALVKFDQSANTFTVMQTGEKDDPLKRQTFGAADVDIRILSGFFENIHQGNIARQWEARIAQGGTTYQDAWMRNRDKGGPGRAGMAYLIGTGAQPELFIPSVDGHFFPNFASDRLNYHMGGRTSMSQRDGDSTTYNVTINATVDPSTGTPENVGDRLGRAFKRRVERL